jgi:hypothetical protein
MAKLLPPPCVAVIDGKPIFVAPDGDPTQMEIGRKLLTITFFEGELTPHKHKTIVTNFDTFVDLETTTEVDTVGTLAEALTNMGEGMKLCFCRIMIEELRKNTQPSAEDTLQLLALMDITSQIISRTNS